MNIRVQVMETVQIGHQKIAAKGVAGTDAQLSALQRIRLQKLSLAAQNQIDCGLNVVKQDFTLRGQRYLLCAANKKGLIQALFQCFDGLADGRLGNKQTL